MIGSLTRLIAALVPLMLLGPVATADPVEGERFSASLGIFFTDRDTKTRLDGSAGRGSDTDLEADLGLDGSDSVFRLDGYYRFNDRHRADFSVFDLSRTGARQIQRDIQWGDRLFAIDTVVESDNDLTIYKAAYTYSFLRRDEGYLGVTGGLYIADAKVSLAEQNLGQAEVGDVTAPLPVIGLRGEYEFAERWTFRGSGEFFFVEFDDIKGSLVDLYLGVDYQLLDYLSIGLGVNAVTLDVDASKTSFLGELNWQYSGGLLFFKFDF